MQMVERPWGVTVHGSATVRAKPDLARIRFRVTRQEMTPSAAFDAVGVAVGAVHEALRRHGVADEAVEQSRLTIRSMQNYGSPPHGYLCEASFVVTTGDLEDVSALVVDVVEAGANEIDQLEFDAAAKDELREEACRQAVAAARRKAELYAEAAAVRLGVVLHIEDVAPDRGGAFLAMAESASTSSPEVLIPGQVTVAATVVMGFALAHD